MLSALSFNNITKREVEVVDFYILLPMHAAMMFQMLPTDSTKQDAIKQTQVLGLSIKTMDYWLTKFVNSGDLQRIMNG